MDDSKHFHIDCRPDVDLSFFDFQFGLVDNDGRIGAASGDTDGVRPRMSARIPPQHADTSDRRDTKKPVLRAD